MRAQSRAAARDAVTRARAVMLTPGSSSNIEQADQGTPHNLTFSKLKFDIFICLQITRHDTGRLVLVLVTVPQMVKRESVCLR